MNIQKHSSGSHSDCIFSGPAIILFKNRHPFMKHYKTITRVLFVLQILAVGILAVMLVRGIKYFALIAK